MCIKLGKAFSSDPAGLVQVESFFSITVIIRDSLHWLHCALSIIRKAITENMQKAKWPAWNLNSEMWRYGSLADLIFQLLQLLLYSKKIIHIQCFSLVGPSTKVVERSSVFAGSPILGAKNPNESLAKGVLGGETSFVLELKQTCQKPLAFIAAFPPEEGTCSVKCSSSPVTACSPGLPDFCCAVLRRTFVQGQRP